MPRADLRVADFNLVSDLNNYYAGSILTLNGQPARVCEIIGNNDHQEAVVQLLSRSGPFGASRSVPFDELNLTIPRLGMVRSGQSWFYLSRNPQRRMKKGYSHDLIRASCVGTGLSRDGCDPMSESIIRQVWYGNTDRISEDVVMVGKSVYFEQEVVAHTDDEGNLIILAGKEKVGEFVCKLLANNWDNISSKFSIKRLPS